MAASGGQIATAAPPPRNDRLSLALGRVVSGSSAGASILSSYLLRGARSGSAIIMAPGSEKGFGFLRGMAIDQHVVACERLRERADSLTD